ncbi:Tox-REase-5 domain-containing protein [Archangium sp.]|uniref:Tox-REase-5 domain-containing protein n=1 Tax=Archangium sp. TaxID=1872627 RepID=UPI00286B2BF0|nr:Tox-REase-5 domain-containing protein [Archangium sp.]
MSTQSPRLSMLALMLLVLSGCATSHAPVAFHSPESEGSAGGFFDKADAFQGVQEASGLDEEARHPAGAAISTEMARNLWSQMAKKPVTQQSFGPRRVLAWVLREALANGGPAAYEELLRHTERFWRVVVMRPDGYLVSALTGRPIQQMGQVTVVDGQYKVGRLVVGAFYFSNGGVLYPVDDSLQRSDRTPWAELGLERDWINAALDGAEDAMVEMAQALAQSVLHPIRTLEGLQQLPSTVALLIASSPEYFERYRAMSLQDQIREAARLSTHLILMYGGAAGTVGTVGKMGGLSAELPVLAVSAEGLLAVRTVTVSAGAMTTTLEVGVGSVAILHMAASGGSQWPPSGGPGQWVQDTSSMSDAARSYQAQATGAPKGWAYKVCRNGKCVEYDGFDLKEGTLQEAKGKGYDQWFDAKLKARFNFQGLDSLKEQAQRQARLAGGLRVRWHVAEPRMVPILQKLFKEWRVVGIEVVYTPPLPLP